MDGRQEEERGESKMKERNGGDGMIKRERMGKEEQREALSCWMKAVPTGQWALMVPPSQQGDVKPQS